MKVWLIERYAYEIYKKKYINCYINGNDIFINRLWQVIRKEDRRKILRFHTFFQTISFIFKYYPPFLFST